MCASVHACLTEMAFLQVLAHPASAGSHEGVVSPTISRRSASGPSSRALLEALVPRVERFELLESELALNNTLRGLGTLKVRVG